MSKPNHPDDHKKNHQTPPRSQPAPAPPQRPQRDISQRSRNVAHTAHHTPEQAAFGPANRRLFQQGAHEQQHGQQQPPQTPPPAQRRAAPNAPKKPKGPR